MKARLSDYDPGITIAELETRISEAESVKPESKSELLPIAGRFEERDRSAFRNPTGTCAKHCGFHDCLHDEAIRENKIHN